MWDERYSEAGYAYGTAPNDFLRKHYAAIPKGKVLSIAEGEGRNAVFLARQGYEVTALDASRVGLDKAARLAEENGVHLKLIHADLNDFDFGDTTWAGIISIFCPLPSALRQRVHAGIARGLQANGVYLIEAYRPEQLAYGTGGGKSADTMLTAETLRNDLPGFDFLHLLETEREVIEGRYHTGLGAVVQAIARKTGPV